jgi:signal transduction histidine kinase
VRDEFISMAAHELKTPLTPLNLQMQLFANMYEDGSMNKVPLATLQIMVRTSVGQVERLNRIVGELLDVSSLNAGHLQIKPAPMNLNFLIEDVLATFHSEIIKANCELTKDYAQDRVGSWDRFRMEQVIINLLTNALKYVEGKPIEI